MVIAADSTDDPTAAEAPTSDSDSSPIDPWNALTKSLTNRLKNQISDVLNPSGEATSESPSDLDLAPLRRPKVTTTGGTADRSHSERLGNSTKPLAAPPTAHPSSVSKTPDPELTRLTAEIVQAFATTGADRSAMSAGIAEHLRGLPPSLVRLVLQDWKADIYGNIADPDPETAFETPVEKRIQRQLQKAGIPLSQLPAEVQQRLQPR